MSSFTKVHQSAGRFSIDLRDDLPQSISQELAMPRAGFAHLVVLPTPMPVEDLDWSALKALSIYTGVIRKRVNRTSLEGAHCTIWLGDEDKKGNIEAVVAGTGQAFEWWVDNLRKGSTGAGTPHLSAGSVQALGGSYTASYNWGSDQTSRRDQINEVCNWGYAEFRVNDDLTLDAGYDWYLYGTNPTVVLTPTMEGRDGGLISLRATFDSAEDVEDWSGDVIYPYTGSATKLAGTHSFLNGLGTDALWQRKLDLDSTKAKALNDAIAAQQLARFQRVRQTLDVRTDAHAVFRDINVGDRVWAWDPEGEVVDLTTTPFYFRGDLIFPVKLVVNAVTMPASVGLGIYVRRGDGEIIDLSRWYVPDTGDASIEVGDRPQSLRAALRSRGFLDQT